MKTLKSFILASLLLYSLRAAACGPWYYSAADNDIYRILPYGMEGPAVQLRPDFHKKNILLWSQQTGCRDTAAIRQAIYNGTLAQWQALRNDTANPDWFGENAFVRHLSRLHDTRAKELLYLSKLYECIRNRQQSPWYYNSALGTDETRELQTLHQRIQQCLPCNDKYADRYRFLAIKCSWALADDSATLALWEHTKRHLKGSIFYSEAEDYAARCLRRMGREDEAIRIYIKQKDMGSLLYLKRYRLPELLEALLRIAPESPVLTVELQRMLFSLENNPYVLYNKLCTKGYYDDTAVLRIALRAARSTVHSRRAMWSYTAACLLDYQRRPEEALQQLEGIDTLPCDAFLKNSIRVMRFYLHAKTDSICDELERYAIEELKWMDCELQREWKRMPERERHKLSRVTATNNHNMYRSCYMYDAMRRILLPDTVGLCQRMAASGRTTRALQMANMAENRFFILTDNKIVQQMRLRDTSAKFTWQNDWGEHPGFEPSWCSWCEPDSTRFSKSYGIGYNDHDYCNWMFLMADRMSASVIDEYRQRLLHPQDADDRWFNARGYTNNDYWQDIVGTHYLRECNYPAAVAHLKQVSPEYQKRMNVTFNHDPFGYKELEISTDSTGYKLHFAQRMVALQKRMRHGDRDCRGMAMLKYSFGMRNSFGHCWELTTYGQTFWKSDFELNRQYGYWPGSIEEWQTSTYPIDRLTALHYPYKMKHTLRADQLQRKALATITSDEVKAEAYARLKMISKVVKEYTHTKTAQHYALVCDQWKDYRLESSGFSNGNTCKSAGSHWILSNPPSFNHLASLCSSSTGWPIGVQR